MIWWRYVEDKDARVISVASPPFKYYLKYMWCLVQKKLKKQLWYQGVGRHSSVEISNIMYQDMKALSDFLGEYKVRFLTILRALIIIYDFMKYFGPLFFWQHFLLKIQNIVYF